MKPAILTTRSLRNTIVLVGFQLLLSACAGNGSSHTFPPNEPPPDPSPSTAGRGTESTSARAQPPPATAPVYSGETARSKRAPRSSGHDDAAPARGGVLRPRSRRIRRQEGLATRWGERRSSEVHSAPFARANRLHPFSVDRLFYNSASGLRRMTGSYNRPYRSVFPVGSGHLEVGLQDASGRYLRGFIDGSRNYIQGRRGSRYSIVLRNHSPGRIEVVVTVDGLDVIDGRSGSLAKRGYLIRPHGQLQIDGWRTSEREVATFRFGTPSQSYSARKHGTTRNVGVIGIAFFHERGDAPRFWQRQLPYRDHPRHSANPFPSRFATSP